MISEDIHATNRAESNRKVARRNAALAVQAVALVSQMFVRKRKSRRSSRLGCPTRCRRRVPIEEIHAQLGPIYFRRAYRMKFSSFKKLAGILKDTIIEKSGKTSSTKHPRYVPNGPITHETRLACALRYSAGASPYDLMTTFGIGHTDTMESFWYVVDAINEHPDFDISFPTNHDEQHAVAAEFKNISDAGFDCCVGAIDGILIWIHRPSESECDDAGVNSGIFFVWSKA
jgi:hypothetical protein